MSQVGRNDPCLCGSGQKYKKCCLNKPGMAPTPVREDVVVDLTAYKLVQTADELVPRLFDHMEAVYAPQAPNRAWDEFTLWSDLPMDAEQCPELEDAFALWLLFDWTPAGVDLTAQGQTEPAQPVAAHYLKSMGTRLSRSDREFLTAACAGQFSFLQVKACTAGRSIQLLDLMCGIEYTVQEPNLSKELKTDDILYAKVISVGDTHVLFGVGSRTLLQPCIEPILELRELLWREVSGSEAGATGNVPLLDPACLREHSDSLRDLYLELCGIWNDMESLDDDDLDLESALHGGSDTITQLTFRLSCSQREAFEALASLSGCSLEETLKYQDVDEDGEIVSAVIPWSLTERRVDPDDADAVEDERTHFTEIFIEGGLIEIDADSDELANQITLEIAERLGDRAVLEQRTVIPVDTHNAFIDGDMEDDTEYNIWDEFPEYESADELKEATSETGGLNLAKMSLWLDQPLEELDDQSPREAMHTPAGRKRLNALLTKMESYLKSQPVINIDVPAMRRTLGL